MDNINYVNVNPLPDEVGGVNQAGNTEEIQIQEPAVQVEENVEGNDETSDTSTRTYAIDFGSKCLESISKY